MISLSGFRTQDWASPRTWGGQPESAVKKRNPTVGLCIGPYGGSYRGGSLSYERGTPVAPSPHPNQILEAEGPKRTWGGQPESAVKNAGNEFALFFFLSSLLLSGLELSDTQVYEPCIQALLGTASHFCQVTWGGQPESAVKNAGNESALYASVATYVQGCGV